jgi:hypothetical protein
MGSKLKELKLDYAANIRFLMRFGDELAVNFL